MSDAAAAVRLTFEGSSYPICSLTFALVYSRLKTTPGAIFRLTYDQRWTLHSYFSYVLSSAGTDRLTRANSQGLPTTVIALLRSGFQANF